MLADAYKTQADLETQLNLAKSNLKLVIANNEMLEEALRHGSGNSKDVGWRRRSGRDSTPEQGYRHSVDLPIPASASTIDSNPDFPAPGSSTRPASPAPSQQENSRFFKFRFSGSSANSTPPMNHLTSPSLPTLPTQSQLKEMEDLSAELEKERLKAKKALEDKVSLEAELESLSQALFEEANKMVATERIKRAETEEELREAILEKEALRSALKLIEGENSHLRSNSHSSPILPPSLSSNETFRAPSRSRSSSEVAVKSRPTTPTSIRLPESPEPTANGSTDSKSDEPPDARTPTSPEAVLPSEESTTQFATYRSSQQYIGPDIPDSPWADVPSASPRSSMSSPESTLVSAAALYAIR
ncbi:hypothetical protein ONZ45_g13571 [Pleurotus djamor]|nr:hypothetical protein ONZ45_g13571 [Pleurotus djamor]